MTPKILKTEETLEQRVAAALAGDAQALDAVLRAIKDDVYGLAMRMLWHPADAEDATQEVLVRVATNLSRFEGRSAFRTWAYRVAVRALLNFKRGRAEAHELSFEEFGRDLLERQQEPRATAHNDSELSVLEQEVRVGCTQAMLLCLDRAHRMAYLLGEILDLDGADAAACLEVTPATYRKRLSRARQQVEAFTKKHCGLVNAAAPCSCKRRIPPALECGRVDPQRLLFATHPVAQVTPSEAQAVVEVVRRICDGASLMRSNPRYLAPERLLRSVRIWGVSGEAG